MTHKAFLSGSTQEKPEIDLPQEVLKKITNLLKENSKKEPQSLEEKEQEVSQPPTKFYEFTHEPGTISAKTFFLTYIDGKCHIFTEANKGSLARIFRSKYRAVTIKKDNIIEMEEDTEYALKVFNPVKNDSDQKRAIESEEAVLSYLHKTEEAPSQGKAIHPRLITGKSHKKGFVKCAIRYKFIEGETLATFLAKDSFKEMSSSNVLSTAKELLEHYRDNFFVRHLLHNDIKPENFIYHYCYSETLCDDDFCFVLIDFGTTCTTPLNENNEILDFTWGTTAAYQAPEVAKARLEEGIFAIARPTEEEIPNERYAASDIYSFGKVFEQIFTTWEAREPSQKAPEAIWDLIKEMTNPDPDERILISKAIKRIEDIRSLKKVENKKEVDDKSVFPESTAKNPPSLEEVTSPIITEAEDTPPSLLGERNKSATPPTVPGSTLPFFEKCGSSTGPATQSDRSPPLVKKADDKKASKGESCDTKHCTNDANYKLQIAAATVVMAAGYTALVLFCPPSLVLWALMAVPALGGGAAYIMDCISDYMSADKTTESTTLSMSA
jgi:serine/threonine protein kinase